MDTSNFAAPSPAAVALVAAVAGADAAAAGVDAGVVGADADVAAVVVAVVVAAAAAVDAAFESVQHTIGNIGKNGKNENVSRIWNSIEKNHLNEKGQICRRNRLVPKHYPYEILMLFSFSHNSEIYKLTCEAYLPMRRTSKRTLNLAALRNK